MANGLITPPGMMTPEHEEELRAYGQALQGINTGPIHPSNPFMSASPWRVALGALRGVQSRSAIDAVERNRGTRRDSVALATPHVATPTPAGSTPVGNQQPSGVLTGDIGNYASAVKSIESSGGDYSLVGRPHPKYGRPLGAYQVMEANLPRWLKEAGLPPMSPEQFLQNRDAQDRVFNHRFGMYLQQFGNPTDAAQAWFAGPGTVGNPRSMDFHDGPTLPGGRRGRGTTVRQYREKFENFMRGVSATEPLRVAELGGGVPSSALGGAPPAAAPPISAPPIPSGGRPPMPGGTEVPPIPGGDPIPPTAGPPTPEATTPPATPGGAAPVSTTGGASNAPSEVPRQIQIDPRVTQVLQRLRNPRAVNEQEFNKLLAEYQTLGTPIEREFALGKALYNPFTGALMNFFPSGMVRRDVRTGDVSTQQLLRPNASGDGLTNIPITGAGGTLGTGVGAGAPGITPRLPPFPEAGNIEQIASWGMQTSAIAEMIKKMGSASTDRVVTAQQAGQRAQERINMLQSISTLTDAAQSTRWTGERLSAWQTQIAQFLTNFDPRSRGERPEALAQLGYRELLQKLNAFLASEATQDISARGTNFEFATLLKNNPNLVSSYEGTKMLVDYMMQEQQRIADLAIQASELHPDEHPNWTRYVRNHYRQNPIMISVPQTVNANTGQVSPAMNITTVPIPRVGDVISGGRGVHTSETVRQFIRSLPPGTWFIHPNTKQPTPAHPAASGGTP